MNDAMTITRVLDARRCPDLQTYLAGGGGDALRAARALEPDVIIDEVTAAGLRGRGGAGFPTGIKWRTVADSRSAVAQTSMVVNAAEGEPGTFKDRAILRRNPYRVLEGALIAAHAVGAPRVVVAMKRSFEREAARVTRAIREMTEAGLVGTVDVRIVFGPSAYLFGEETALLEVLDGRPPFPRVAPPFRRGLESDDGRDHRYASDVHLASVGGTDEAPALIDNVETLANVPLLVAKGAAWFRSVGTERSPGTIVCTITGDVTRHGVLEVAMGTPLRDVIGTVGSAVRGTRIQAVLSGVANPFLTEADLDTPITYEDMDKAHSSLGAAGFIVFDDRTDIVAAAQAVARFLSIESCGQCEPCKRDGLELARLLDLVRTSRAGARELRAVAERTRTVANGARCFLGQQQQRVVGSLLERFPDALQRHIHGAPAADPVFIAPIVDLFGGRAVLDQTHRTKQPDWTHGETSSLAWPAARPRETIAALAADTAPHEPPPAAMAVPRVAGLSQLRGLHDDIEGSLEAVAAESDNGHDAAQRLRTSVELYADVAQRVLYPMVRRVGGRAGEDAAAASESAVDELLRGARSATLPADTMNKTFDLLDRDEDLVVGVLCTALDDDALDELDQGLAEARATSLVHGARR
jgi:NADH:ubiquinone oxidoreductase subunit F (NADH-binding)